MSTISLAIEMGTNLDNSKYGMIHAAGCRDLRDGFEFETEPTKAAADKAAEETSGWEDNEWGYSPCAKKLLK